MKWLPLRLNKWLVIVLVVAFFVMLIQSYTLRVFARTSLVEIGGVNQLNCLAESENNSAEVDGLIFEILIPERVWVIPENRADVETPLKIGICITNNRKTPVRLTRLDPSVVLGLNIQAADGSELKGGGYRDILMKSPQMVCPFLLPQESVKFFLDVKLYWRDNKLFLGGSDGLGGGWEFVGLKAGNYKIRFGYYNSSAVGFCYDREMINQEPTGTPEFVQDLWGGVIAWTPFVDVRLVESPLNEKLD